jgi:hypothetical protein
MSYPSCHSKKITRQLKIIHVIILLFMYTPSKRKLTEGSMMHRFETLETISASFKR